MLCVMIILNITANLEVKKLTNLFLRDYFIQGNKNSGEEKCQFPTILDF